jgi:hypothetical protein
MVMYYYLLKDYNDLQIQTEIVTKEKIQHQNFLQNNMIINKEMNQFLNRRDKENLQCSDFPNKVGASRTKYLYGQENLVNMTSVR